MMRKLLIALGVCAAVTAGSLWVVFSENQDGFSAAKRGDYATALAPATASAKAHEGDPEKGKRMFLMCAGCHSLKPGEIRAGPSLAGLLGRKAGSVPGFRYSKALKNAPVIWDEKTLDAWLANPRKLIPGNRMPFRGLRKEEHRADVIAFLKEATQ